MAVDTARTMSLPVSTVLAYVTRRAHEGTASV